MAGGGERTYKPGLKFPPAPQGAPNRLVAWPGVRTAVLGRWLLVFAGVVFAVVTLGGGGRVFSFFVLVQVLQRSGAGPAICHGARGARTRAAADSVLSKAISKEEAAKTVGLRLPSMSTNYVFACVV